MDRSLLAILACPRCKGEISLSEGEKDLVCAPCGLSYPIRAGIPQLLAEESHPTVVKVARSSVATAGGLIPKISFVVGEGKSKGSTIELEKGS